MKGLEIRFVDGANGAASSQVADHNAIQHASTGADEDTEKVTWLRSGIILRESPTKL
ncbi:hypothetical protein CONPUDRAFT_168342, partial [Coniophora puteana RWD-64-598 SS2]